MTALPQRFIEDKALRDAAKAVLDADLAHLNDSLAAQGIAGRVRAQLTGKVRRRISAGARDVLDQAKGAAEDNRGVLAVLVGALVLWLAREPLLSALGLGAADDAAQAAGDDQPEDAWNEPTDHAEES